jgi:hypothetical protein
VRFKECNRRIPLQGSARAQRRTAERMEPGASPPGCLFRKIAAIGVRV